MKFPVAFRPADPGSFNFTGMISTVDVISSGSALVLEEQDNKKKSNATGCINLMQIFLGAYAAGLVQPADAARNSIYAIAAINICTEILKTMAFRLLSDL